MSKKINGQSRSSLKSNATVISMTQIDQSCPPSYNVAGGNAIKSKDNKVARSKVKIVDSTTSNNLAESSFKESESVNKPTEMDKMIASVSSKLNELVKDESVRRGGDKLIGSDSGCSENSTLLEELANKPAQLSQDETQEDQLLASESSAKLQQDTSANNQIDTTKPIQTNGEEFDGAEANEDGQLETTKQEVSAIEGEPTAHVGEKSEELTNSLGQVNQTSTIEVNDPSINQTQSEQTRDETTFEMLKREQEAASVESRKYFVYLVHDGNLATTKKECIAQIELPLKKRITLAELRQMIVNSQDVTSSSLRRNKFRFVTETYRLLNENEDAAILHQTYSAEGVFLKMNIGHEQEISRPQGPSRGRVRSPAGMMTSLSSLQQLNSAKKTRNQTVGSGGGRRVQASSKSCGPLPIIEVGHVGQNADQVSGEKIHRTSSVDQKTTPGHPVRKKQFMRSKSTVQQAARGHEKQDGDGSNSLPTVA